MRDWIKYSSLIVACCLPTLAVSAGDPVLEGFIAPPPPARPRVWWHWMNGNVSKEGIKLDLEWMKRIGIGGVQNFDAGFEPGSAFYTPQVVGRPLHYLSAEWQDSLRFSVGLASELGLEFTIASSAGWSVTGGPWVEARQAMKKLVWSETVLKGGRRFKGKLAKPPETTGPFQNMPLASATHAGTGGKTEQFYADAAVVAYRLSKAEVRGAELEPRVTSSAGTIDADALSDGDLAKTIDLPFANEQDAWIQFSYSKPTRILAITLAVGNPWGGRPPLTRSVRGSLEATDDGVAFRKLADLPRHDALQQTVAFPPALARVFRVRLEPPVPSVREQLGLAVPVKVHQVAELVLHAGGRVNRFENKGGYSALQIDEQDDTPRLATEDVIRRGDVVDLTSKVTADGYLDWIVPPGNWLILRYGYTLTGSTNSAASAAGTGFEVDKLSRDNVTAYMQKYLGHYEKALGPELMGRKGVRYLLTDSYEAGPQNWTDDLLTQFERRRGYSAVLWLPVLAGRVVESAVSSDRFLWDFRKTLNDLITESHYEEIAALLRQRGLGVYGESHELRRAFVGDGMQVKKVADVPMGAMWAARPPNYSQEGNDADIRESASVAHIYGRNVVAAESFTAYGNPYGFAPAELKPIADRAMVMGLNRFVIHTSVHQPDARTGPGISLGPFGQWFTRKEVWAEQAEPWIRYLARSSYLLQQGRFVADIAYLYGEDTNLTELFAASAPAIPNGYNFDFINADALLTEVSVREGKLVTRAGMEYRVLALDASTRRMSLPVLRKLRDLVRAGAAIVGSKPIGTPSLADNDGEFRAIAAELWGSASAEHAVGAGKVFADQTLSAALHALQLSPDVRFLSPVGTELRSLHRAMDDDGHLYFVTSDNAHPLMLEASFRISGKKPELWRADTGTIAPLSYRIENGRTIVPLRLERQDAVFVLFRQTASVPSVVIPEPDSKLLTTLEGPWDVRFPPELGAPPHAHFDKLFSWTESGDEGIKYFSGLATYSKTVQIRRDWLKYGARVQMDLGEVRNLAEILINGRSLGVLWKAPFRIDITDALKAGGNRIEIKATNLWPNRLIGDKRPGARKIAVATFDPFKADSPLLPSGLLGPVTLTQLQPYE